MGRPESIAIIESALPAVAQVLPVPSQAERFIKLARLAVASQPQLADADKGSLIRALLQLAKLGIEPGTGYGAQAYLVPFWDSRTKKFQVVPIISAQGLINVLTHSGVVTKIESQVVFSNDAFKLVFGSQPVLYHEPKIQGDRGQPVGAWAMATLRDGTMTYEWMGYEDIERVRSRSHYERRRQEGSAGPSGPWDTDWDEMAKKTVIKRLCKRLPLSPLISQAIQSEGLAEDTVEVIEEATATTAQATKSEEDATSAANGHIAAVTAKVRAAAGHRGTADSASDAALGTANGDTEATGPLFEKKPGLEHRS